MANEQELVRVFRILILAGRPRREPLRVPLNDFSSYVPKQLQQHQDRQPINAHPRGLSFSISNGNVRLTGWGQYD